jgi:hypothetical protein
MFLRASAPLRETLRYALVAAFAFYSVATLAADDVVIDTVLTNLRQPCGITVQPGGTADRYELLIAEGGAGRIVRWSNLERDATPTVVEGVPTSETNRSRPQPVPIAFLDAGLIVVGTTADGGGVLRVFELPEKDEALRANEPRDAVKADGEVSACVAIARSRSNDYVPDLLLTVARLHNGATALWKSRVQAGTLGPLQPFGPTAGANPPSAITTSPTGRFVVVERPAGADDSRLVFYSPIDGAVELSMPLELSDVVALAYSPSSSNLYAADAESGVFRIDDASAAGRPASRAVKIADVVGPTSLVFAPDGALYATTLGRSGDVGTLTVITGDL